MMSKNKAFPQLVPRGSCPSCTTSLACCRQDGVRFAVWGGSSRPNAGARSVSGDAHGIRSSSKSCHLAEVFILPLPF